MCCELCTNVFLFTYKRMLQCMSVDTTGKCYHIPMSTSDFKLIIDLFSNQCSLPEWINQPNSAKKGQNLHSLFYKFIPYSDHSLRGMVLLKIIFISFVFD